MIKFRLFALGAVSVAIASCETVPTPISAFPDSEVFSGKIGFESVTFEGGQESLKQLISSASSASRAEVFGYLDLPENISGKVPAMILVHDSSGPSERDIRYAKELNQSGVATFRIDSFAPRGFYPGSSRGSVSTFSSVADAYNALKLLSTHPQIDKTRIGIIGWSRGGGIAHLTAFEPFRKGFIQDDLQFAVHIPFYRPCAFEVRMPMTNASVRELLGEKDDHTSVPACVADAKRQREKGYDIETIVYPGAHHSFDKTQPVTWYENTVVYRECHFIIEADGTTFDPVTKRQWSRANTKRNLKACVKTGATKGNNAEASRKSMVFVKAHLRKVFGL